MTLTKMSAKTARSALRRMATISPSTSGFSIKIPGNGVVLEGKGAWSRGASGEERLRVCAPRIWQYCDNFLAPDEQQQLLSEFSCNEQNQNRRRRGGELFQLPPSGH